MRKEDFKVSVVIPVLSYEKSVSLKTYLFYEDKIDLFGYAILKDDSAGNLMPYVEGWKTYFENKQLENMSSKPGLLIFLDNRMIDKFFKTSNFMQGDYIPVDMGKSPFVLLKKIS